MNMQILSTFFKKLHAYYLSAKTKQNADISLFQFVLLISMSNAIAYNIPLLIFSVENLDYWSLNGIQILFTLFFVIFTVTALFLFIVHAILPVLTRFICALIFIGNAVALYFISIYKVVLDKSMMGNILNTRISETADFLNINSILFVLLFGILPALLLLKLRIKKKGMYPCQSIR